MLKQGIGKCFAGCNYSDMLNHARLIFTYIMSARMSDYTWPAEAVAGELQDLQLRAGADRTADMRHT